MGVVTVAEQERELAVEETGGGGNLVILERLVFVGGGRLDVTDVVTVREQLRENLGIARRVPVLTDPDDVRGCLGIGVGRVVHASGRPGDRRIRVMPEAGGNAQALANPPELFLVGE